MKLPNGAYRIAPRNGSARGRETIDAARLDRDDLDELREAHRRLLESVAALVEEAKDSGNPSRAARALTLAQSLSSAQSPFALFARVFFRDRGVL